MEPVNPAAAALDVRRAGVLLPLSALGAPLGRGGRAFVDWLAEAGFSVWQVLPIGPPDATGSPYWAASDHAGGPAYLDPDELPGAQDPGLADFVAANAGWLPDYALFAALTAAYAGAPFWRWAAPLREREPDALERARGEHAETIAHTVRLQNAFEVQWQRLRAYAHARGVHLFGDLPFYVAPSSVATWTQRALFQLGPDGEPAAVAGVPPDYFSDRGQLWGNPLYDWPAHARTGYAWWIERVRAQLRRLDLLRIDHFRALVSHWAVPAGAADARPGAWVPTPGAALLEHLRTACGGMLPLVAEDLGVITDEVVALRERFGLPGMRVLQFAFDGEPGNPHLPHRHGHRCVAYTGTHDNDTALGWYAALDEATRARADLYLGIPPAAMPEALIRAALGSVAQLAVVPAQDLLGLDSAARLNTPGSVRGNWAWRVPPGALTGALARRYAALNRVFGRS